VTATAVGKWPEQEQEGRAVCRGRARENYEQMERSRLKGSGNRVTAVEKWQQNESKKEGQHAEGRAMSRREQKGRAACRRESYEQMESSRLKPSSALMTH
jgi:hypothetical protein